MIPVEPKEGHSYLLRRSGEVIRVVNVDATEGVIYFSDDESELDEANFDEWYTFEPEPYPTLSMSRYA